MSTVLLTCFLSSCSSALRSCVFCFLLLRGPRCWSFHHGADDWGGVGLLLSFIIMLLLAFGMTCVFCTLLDYTVETCGVDLPSAILSQHWSMESWFWMFWCRCCMLGLVPCSVLAQFFSHYRTLSLHLFNRMLVQNVTQSGVRCQMYCQLYCSQMYCQDSIFKKSTVTGNLSLSTVVLCMASQPRRGPSLAVQKLKQVSSDFGLRQPKAAGVGKVTRYESLHWSLRLAKWTRATCQCQVRKVFFWQMNHVTAERLICDFLIFVLLGESQQATWLTNKWYVFNCQNSL